MSQAPGISQAVPSILKEAEPRNRLSTGYPHSIARLCFAEMKIKKYHSVSDTIFAMRIAVVASVERVESKN
jgi:hypothetical protein